MQKLVLGLDIGVSSVGWGIIDQETGKIIDCAARIFPQAEKDDNLIRRTMRGNKRLLRRKKHRLERIETILNKIDIIRPEYKKYCDTNPYEIRLKGLTKKLSKDEIFIAIMHLAKRRGISYLEDLELDKDNKISNETIKQNLELSKNQYICEIQLDRLKENGAIRGHDNVFETKKYIEEVEKILSTQAKYYEEIDEDFINNIVEIIRSKREYADGPGSEKSRTDYGRFKTNGETLDNLFEILIGKCTIFPSEFRCPKASYDAQLFNFLNDLNNIKVNNEKLTVEQKKKIFDTIFNSKSVNIMKIISNITDVEEELIEGYRIDKSGKPKFHKFEIYRNFFKQLEAKEINTSAIDINSYNEISYILTLETVRSKKRERLNERVGYLGKELIEAICNIDDSKFNGWHSLSYKAINEIIDDLWNTSKEQQTLFTEHNLLKPDYDKYKGKSNIPTDFIDEEILNPIARRSIRQAVNITNVLRKKYGELDSIIIEMAREFTTDPKEIEKEQKKNYEKKQKAAKLVEPFGYTIKSLPGEVLTMLCLWQDQGGRCIYSNKSISIDDLINNHELFQIDHIIPKSISFDDGYNNKVLCYRNENQNKGQKIPSRYYASGKNTISYEEFKENVINLNKTGLISDKKKDLLLFDKDINKYEVRQGFINRNLQDTRYSTKQVLSILQDYMKANDIKTTIFTVKGSYTHNIRRKWNLDKDRHYYKHHVIDALIIAASNNNKFYKTEPFYWEINKLLKNELDTNSFVNVTNEEYDKLTYSEPYIGFIRQLKSLEPKISHRVDTKVNRAISDQTIKSSRIFNGDEYVISKLSNIYDQDGVKLKEKILNNPESLLLYHHDKETFKLLREIVDNYPNVKNPFLEYFNEFGKIKRYSKKGNGPDITSVKYMDKKLGSHLSIKHKYKDSKNNVFLLSIKPYRMDVYKNEEGLYKFVSITYAMFKFKNSELVLDEEKLADAKLRKEIDNHYDFCFSLNTGDCFEIQIDDTKQEYVFMGVNSDSRNCIECNYVNRQRNTKEGERIKLTIGAKVKEFRKYHTDILGNKYYCNKADKNLLTIK